MQWEQEAVQIEHTLLHDVVRDPERRVQRRNAVKLVDELARG